MSYYLIKNKNKNKIIGAYSDYDSAKNYILSCYQNNFQIQGSIISCYKDTCLFYKEDIVENTFINTFKPVVQEKEVVQVETKVETKVDNNLFITPEYLEKCETKCKLQHDINLLKQKKHRIEQSKCVYENDLKIYYIFKKSTEDSTSFVIPEIFSKKYNIFKLLENNNKLSWENFVSEYKNEDMYNDYFGLSYHDEKIIEPSDNIIEQFDVSSEYISSEEK